jgi:hypothetical protein
VGCKSDITQNLDLPEQFKFYNKEYVYVWVAPYGNYDEVVDSLLGSNFYLAPRLYTPGYHSLPKWDEKSNKFAPFGVSLEIGPTEIDGQWWMGTDDIDVLNSTFDSVSAEAGIYHATIHPNTDVYLEDYFHQHLDYISERKNIWYVATGHLFLYHFAQIHSNKPATLVQNSSTVPSTTKLYQNYPNPFNPSTVINYELGIKSEVNLSVYNVIGQKVATLVSQTQQAGSHLVEWNATGLSSGIYMYCLQAGNHIEVKKMALMR